MTKIVPATPWKATMRGPIRHGWGGAPLGRLLSCVGFGLFRGTLLDLALSGMLGSFAWDLFVNIWATIAVRSETADEHDASETILCSNAPGCKISKLLTCLALKVPQSQADSSLLTSKQIRIVLTSCFFSCNNACYVFNSFCALSRVVA